MQTERAASALPPAAVTMGAATGFAAFATTRSGAAAETASTVAARMVKPIAAATRPRPALRLASRIMSSLLSSWPRSTIGSAAAKRRGSTRSDSAISIRWRA